MSRFEFTKMQGLGNDFVVLDGPARPETSDIARMCDRRFGIGADGVLVVTPGSPIVMDYWNADGSSAEMCGNGLRCVARYARDRGWAATDEFEVDTPAGPRSVRIEGDLVEVEIGPALIEGETTIEGDHYTLVDTGNPHAVRVVGDPATVDVPGLGARVAGLAGFDAGCNVEFIAVDGDEVRMRVWERGVGETLACGTGMAAAAVVALGGGDGTVRVVVPGGVGQVRVEDKTAWLTGPAEYSFTGVFDQG